MSKDKISIEKYQEIDFNEAYINSRINQLNNIKTNLEEIIKKSDNLKEQIATYFNSINTCFQKLLNEIESCMSWFKEKDTFNNQKKS